MKVLKFGGTSVANADRIKSIGSLLFKRIKNDNENLVVICSALSGVTDLLISMSLQASNGKKEYKNLYKTFEDKHNQLLEDLNVKSDSSTAYFDNLYKTLNSLLRGIYLVREASPRTMDYVKSFGERSSNYVIALYLNKIGVESNYVDARKIIKTDKSFGKALVNYELTEDLIKKHFKNNPKTTQIITGYIASDVGGLTTTLGRGGSDYTASIVCAALDAEILEIWTDVDGVLTSDPRVVQNAYTIPKLTYNEAMEMANTGAKVIYSPTIQPVLQKSIPILIKNTFNHASEGTLISHLPEDKGDNKVVGLTSFSDISLITLEGFGIRGDIGFAARFFSALASEHINILMISQTSSEQSICVAVRSSQQNSAQEVLIKEFEREIAGKMIKPPAIEKDLCALAIIGEKMKNIPGVAGRLFSSLGKNGINVIAIAQGSSELNISFIIKSADRIKAMNLIHDSFFLHNKKYVNVFLIGTGLIGKTLLNQINKQKDFLLKEKNIDVSIVGIANSKKYVLNENGIDLSNWSHELDKSDRKMNIDVFLKEIQNLNLSQAVLVDCTASSEVPMSYESILKKSISIITPNKIGASKEYKFYSNIRKTAIQNNVRYLFETNVGAGLPIIQTLQDLVDSGDQITSIQAIVSGSISFIFNQYDGSVPFYQVVQLAQKKGFTEPDPRIDLSGGDVKRKIIILARVAGFQIEGEDVIVEPFVPEKCMKADSIDTFIEELKNSETHFHNLIEKAKLENLKLRHIATFDGKKAIVRLQYVDSSSSFYNLSENDNMVIYHSERYKERPLVIQGPGAGADVTAAGIFAEIITLSNT